MTVLLEEWSQGDSAAFEALTPLVYPELQSIASAFLRRGGRWGLLQTTDVVNELFLKLIAQAPRKMESRRHFFALCARMIRHALVDHCRANLAAKRGGASNRVTLHEEMIWVDAAGPEMIELDRALDELERLDRQQAELLGLRFILGCTAEETAALSGLSKATVDRKVRLARIWLYKKLNGPREADSAGFPQAEV